MHDFWTLIFLTVSSFIFAFSTIFHVFPSVYEWSFCNQYLRLSNCHYWSIVSLNQLCHWCELVYSKRLNFVLIKIIYSKRTPYEKSFLKIVSIEKVQRFFIKVIELDSILNKLTLFDKHFRQLFLREPVTLAPSHRCTKNCLPKGFIHQHPRVCI